MRCVVVMYLFIGTVGGEEVGGSFLNCWCILLPAHTQYTLVTWSIQAVYKSIYKHFRFRLMNTMFWISCVEYCFPWKCYTLVSNFQLRRNVTTSEADEYELVGPAHF